MKSRTVLLPAAFAGTALFGAVPDRANAATEPFAMTSNALVAELDTVVGAARASNGLLAGMIVAVVAPPGAPTTSRTCPAGSLGKGKLYKAPGITKTCPTSSGPAKLYKNTTKPKIAPKSLSTQK